MAENISNKDRLRDITDGIEQGIKDLFESDRYMQYLRTMSRFHKYSVNNVMLINMQKPDATLVAGFNKWRDQFERHVKKGERGIKIIAPTPLKKKQEREKIDPITQAPVLGRDGKVVTEEVEIQIPLFNSTRPREYDGQHITFSGINPEIRLREHQLNAIAHVLYGDNVLLAHEVGVGKTFEMTAAAMESKRLGLCQKSLFAVPNHLTEQWTSEFLRLYPAANILVATKKDFESRNRKKFCAKIATGDYDAIIIGHSQFERLPVSMERREQLLQEQIWEIEEGLAELKSNNAEKFSIKQLERTKRSLEARLEKLQDGSRKDDVVTFEQLGVDRLFIDEAHNYKNLFLYTKMRNVAGLSTTDAQKSSDMLLKCRYIDEKTGGRGVVFATGTPVSNSMTELYTMQRYLQHDLLRDKGLAHFDNWASIFGETVTAIELAPEGTGYRARTRFAKFFNLPELMTMFKETADIKTADQLDLPTPEVEFHNEVAQPTEHQQDMVQELSERAAEVHTGRVDPRVDNMLKITNETHFMVQISPDFLLRASSKNQNKLFDMLPFQSLTFSGLTDRKGIYALIAKDENRNQSLRQRKSSVRGKLQAQPDVKPQKPAKKKEVER